MFDKIQHLSKIRGYFYVCNQEIMGNAGLPPIEGRKEQLDSKHPLRHQIEKAYEQVSTAAKTGILSVLAGLGGAGAVSAEEVARAAYNPLSPVAVAPKDGAVNVVLLDEFNETGRKAGDRGGDRPNKFDKFIVMFQELTPASQKFILEAFGAGKLTEAPAGKDLDAMNGKLAANLIRMITDMEVLAKFVVTRKLPESGKLPRADDNLERILRLYPNAGTVITPEFRTRVAELEADVDRVLNERVVESSERLEELEAVNRGLKDIERRMQALYDAVNS